MIRIAIGVLTLVTILVGVLQWLAEPLLVRTLKSQLENSDIELVELDITRLSPGFILIEKLELNSPDWQLSAADLRIIVKPDAEIDVSIESTQIELLPSESTGPAMSLSELFQRIDESVGLLPESGRLKEVEYCQPGICLNASVHWQRKSSELAIQIGLPQQAAQLEVGKTRANWQGSVIARQESVDLLLAFSTNSPEEAIFRLETDIWLDAKNPSELPEVALDLGIVTVEGVSQLPFNTKLDEVLISLISNHQVKFAGQVSYVANALQVGANGSYQLEVEYVDQDVSIANMLVPEVSLQLPEIGTATFDLGTQSRCAYSLGLGSFECEVKQLDSSWDIEHELGTFAADANLKDINLEYFVGEIDVQASSELNLFDLSTGLGLIQAEFDLGFVDNVVSVTRTTGQLVNDDFELSLQHALGTEQGELDFAWQSASDLNVLATYITTKLALEPEVVEIASELAGGYQLKTKAKWDLDLGQLEQQTDVQISDLTAEYDGYQLNGGTLTSTLSGYPKVDAGLELAANNLYVGVPVSQLRLKGAADYQVDTGEFKGSAESLRFEVLGGEVVSTELSYQLPQRDGMARFDMQGIQLAQLLALQQQDFESEGVLSGSVPVQIDSGNLSVTNASIVADAPGGFVKYSPEPSVLALAESNTGVGVVLEAMKNFQYHTLQAEVDYAADGKMLARTSLKGANPDYQEGREVHLNLNLEENILVLLKSLRLGSDIAERITEKRGQIPEL